MRAGLQPCTDSCCPTTGILLLSVLPDVCYGAAARYLGMLAATMERWEDAAQHFEDALAMNARMGARPWLAHTQHQYAIMLLARHQPGDRDKAMSLLQEALTTARALGMHALERRITIYIEPRPASVPAAPDVLDDLSQREVEVLRLLAAGKEQPGDCRRPLYQPQYGRHARAQYSGQNRRGESHRGSGVCPAPRPAGKLSTQETLLAHAASLVEDFGSL